MIQNKILPKSPAPRKEFQVKVVKVDRESVLRQSAVF